MHDNLYRVLYYLNYVSKLIDEINSYTHNIFLSERKLKNNRNYNDIILYKKCHRLLRTLILLDVYVPMI